jgi:pyruvate kinase
MTSSIADDIVLTDGFLAASFGAKAVTQRLTQRGTKVVCTVGPASCDEDTIRKLIGDGVDCFRLNFSHGDHESHTKACHTIRDAAASLETEVGILQDLCGPKIRISRVADVNYNVKVGDVVRVTTDGHSYGMVLGEHFDISTTYDGLLTDLGVGDRLAINDGRIELVVEHRKGVVFHARVLRGGRIERGKGLNMPGVHLSADSITEKDWNDLEWGIAQKVDFIALSFVRHPDDLQRVRSRLDQAGVSCHLVAKIERPEAIQHIAAIIRLADALMIARGDLGVETELARVPLLQKHLIGECRAAGKPVITATQMLESMVEDSTPTRAEVSDVANAILDGTDAVMLSAETATGRHPREAVRVLRDVARAADSDLIDRSVVRQIRHPARSETDAVVDGAVAAAVRLRANAIVVQSHSGATARMISQRRPSVPIVAVTSSAETSRQLRLVYGVTPILVPDKLTAAELITRIDGLLLERHLAHPSDTVVFVGGMAEQGEGLDTMHIHRIGN